jgi:hypothetical protein
MVRGKVVFAEGVSFVVVECKDRRKLNHRGRGGIASEPEETQRKHRRKVMRDDRPCSGYLKYDHEYEYDNDNDNEGGVGRWRFIGLYLRNALGRAKRHV